jgi:chromosome segregation ATPase
VGGSGTQGTSDVAQGTQATASNASQSGATGNTRQEVEQLRAQVQSLQAQLAAQQEESTANAQRLQQQLTGIQDRAAELERMRQQRLSELDRARTWMVTADQALEVGELAVGDALGEADSALAQVLDSASNSGSGQTVTLIEDARSLIAQALESTGHRDTLQARQFLFGADWRVREARRQNLDAPSAAVVTQ